MSARDAVDSLLPRVGDAGAPHPALSETGAYPGARALPSSAAFTRGRHERRYLPTLFDRLCDEAPGEDTEVPEAYASDRTRMRQIVQRDLALLLNTTDQGGLFDADRLAQARRSTLNYGVPALAGGYLSDKRWADIENMIRRAILTFEPRLLPETLVVRPLIKEHTTAHYNVLVFEISGHIQMQPYPLEFTVQSSVDLETSRIELTPARMPSP